MLVINYCKTNYRRIGRLEDPNGEDEAVQELLKICPIHLTRWMNTVAYGKEEPGPHDRPTQARANTLLAHKRALSYYMRRKTEFWDWNAPGGWRGNPTKSPDITKLIDRVETLENKGHGAQACDSRAFTKVEMLNIIDDCRQKVRSRDSVQMIAHPAFLLTQFHLDARLVRY